MTSQNNAVSTAQTEQIRPQSIPQPHFDFSSCQRMKKLTTHDIYRFPHHQQSLILKMFAPNAHLNYQNEVACLHRASHPSIIKVLYHRPSIDPSSSDPLRHSHLIVMQEAARGDLNEYLPRYGKMTQKMARTYFKNLVQSLKQLSQLTPPLIHPNLQPSNILLTSEGDLRICGWSQLSSKEEQQRLNENIFCCGEILICLLTTSMPFYKKNSPTDTYYKFLTQEHISKFWQQILKKMVKIDKKFAFSAEVKDLLESILLKKVKGFDDLLNHQWTKGDSYPLDELVKILEENERIKNEKINMRRNQQAIREQKKRNDLHAYQLSFGNHRSSLEDNHQFIKDCQENIIHQQEIPISQKLCCLKVQATPSFMIASLKDFLRNQNGKSTVILCEQFILNNHKVAKVTNYVLIDLQFAIGDLQQQQEQLLEPQLNKQTVSLRLKVSFARKGKQIFADVQVVNSNFNSYYTNLALHFIEERMEKRRECSK